MKIKALFVSALLLGAFLLLPAFASAQLNTVARVESQSGNTLRVNRGSSAGLQAGDVLVVQRDGQKLGLIRLINVISEAARGEVIASEPGVVFMSGDLAAFQLMPGGRPYEKRNDRFIPDGEILESFPTGGPDKGPSFVYNLVPDIDNIIEREKTQTQINPHDRAAMVRLADAYFKKNWYEMSIKWYKQALELAPRARDNDKLLFQVARGYGLLKQIDKQRLYIDFIRRNYPNSVFATASLDAPENMLLEPPSYKKELIPEEMTSTVINERAQYAPRYSSPLQRGGMRSMSLSGARGAEIEKTEPISRSAPSPSTVEKPEPKPAKSSSTKKKVPVEDEEPAATTSSDSESKPEKKKNVEEKLSGNSKSKSSSSR